MKKKLSLTPSPHIRTKETVETVMYDVVIALIPASIAATYFFGLRALIMILLSVLTAVISEAICQIIMKREIEILDGSAIITGILFAFVVPPSLPYWLLILGSAISMIIGKMIFGGLGHNIFNPALVGRVFLMASWPEAMTRWTNVRMVADGSAGATVLGLVGKSSEIESGMYLDLFLGKVGGSLGETSALALLIGGGYLLYRKQITWHIPVSYIGTVFILSILFGQNPIIHVLSGGLLLGAFFMATDMVTSPYTKVGKLIFGIGAGILVAWIRVKGALPEGVAYSILIMNGFTSVINKYTRPRIFGEVPKDEK